MENKFLGETVVDIKDTPFKDYKKEDWVLYFIETYGQYDGGHHKQWVLDQIVRILKGTAIEIKLAKWSNGLEEYRIRLLEPTEDYKVWVSYMRNEQAEDDNLLYSYDEGIAP